MTNLLEDENKVGDILTLKQELFCQYFVSDHEAFGNATKAYALAYSYDLESLSKVRPKVKDTDAPEDDEEDEEDLEDEEDYDEEEAPRKKKKTKYKTLSSEYELAYNLCSVEGSKLLRNPKVKRRCEDLLNDYLENRKVDSELSKLIFQNKDYTSKLNAIKEYNKLKQRIIDKREDTIDYTGNLIILPTRNDDSFRETEVDTDKLNING